MGWIVVWILSLYHTNGVSRGNSQIALLVTGLTAAVRSHIARWLKQSV